MVNVHGNGGPIKRLELSYFLWVSSELTFHIIDQRLLLMLSSCGIVTCHISWYKIRADATMRFNHVALSESHQGKIILSSMFMLDILELSNKLIIDS